MLFRIGGDEFVLISLSANETELEQRLEQVRAGPVSYTHLDVYKRQNGGVSPVAAQAAI